jgi:hypothetical protein
MLIFFFFLVSLGLSALRCYTNFFKYLKKDQRNKGVEVIVFNVEFLTVVEKNGGSVGIEPKIYGLISLWHSVTS